MLRDSIAFIHLNAASGWLKIDPAFAQRAESYAKQDLIKIRTVEGRTEIAYNSSVGCLPLGKQTFVLMLPPGLNILTSNDSLKFISLLLKYFGQRSSADLAQLPTAKSSGLKISQIVPVESLAESLARVLSEIPDYPLRKITRTRSIGNRIKGKIDVRSVYKSLYLRPGMRVVSYSPRVSRDFPENRLIKAAIVSLTEQNLFLDQQTENRFTKYLRSMVDVGSIRGSKSHSESIKSTIPALDLAVAISKSLLTGKSFIGVRDFLEIEVPAFRADYDFFEFMVRDAFQRVLKSADKDSIGISSQNALTFNPDLVIPYADADSAFVIDMKFKNLKFGEHGTKNRSDIYQILAHSMSYLGSHALGLVYPQSEGRFDSEVLRLDRIHPPKTIIAYWVDLRELFEYVTLQSNGEGLESMIMKFFFQLEEEANIMKSKQAA